MRRAAAALLLALLVAPLRAQEAQHPRELQYPPLEFAPPTPASCRVKLANGLTAYLVPDATLPSVRVRAYIRTGGVYDPEGKEGLSGLVFAAIRTCGAGALDPDEVDARLDELGATIDADCSDTRAVIDAWMLSAHVDAVLEVFADVLRRPQFDEEKFDRLRDDSAAEAKGDEDDMLLLATRRMREQLYGEHPYARFRSPDTLASIGRDDAKAFHRKFVTPGRVVLAVSGRFERDSMKQKLEKLFGTWKGEGTGWEPVPLVPSKATGGIRVIDHPDIASASIELGRRACKAGAADEPALIVADHIWGSGSFTSRVTAKIRTEEALAYTCGSEFEAPSVLPGIARTYFQVQAGEASYALRLALDEARRLAKEGPTPEELERAKRALVGRFPALFTTAANRARALADADLEGLPDDHYARYRERIAAVTAEDVKAATAKYFGPDGVSIVIVGPAERVRRNATRGTDLDALGAVTVE